MQIIAHRGYWKSADEKNTLNAFKAALQDGYGIETDFRDCLGELIISHDIANEQSLKVRALFELYSAEDNNVPLAINIKSDGIQGLLKKLLEEFHISNYFLFDMSVPEMVVARSVNLKFYTRQSDVENECVLYKDACGVWLDSFFEKDWLTIEILKNHLQNQKKVGLISPEIHGYDKYKMWRMLKEEGIISSSLVSICTDTPGEAKEYFYD